MTAIVHIAAAPDGVAIAQAIRDRLAARTAIPDGPCPGTLPAAHEKAVLVFVLTDQALADPAVQAYAALAAGSRFLVLPVVLVRSDFDFAP